jgi:hypothetical protein
MLLKKFARGCAMSVARTRKTDSLARISAKWFAERSCACGETIRVDDGAAWFERRGFRDRGRSSGRQRANANDPRDGVTLDQGAGLRFKSRSPPAGSPAAGVFITWPTNQPTSLSLALACAALSGFGGNDLVDHRLDRGDVGDLLQAVRVDDRTRIAAVAAHDLEQVQAIWAEIVPRRWGRGRAELRPLFWTCRRSGPIRTMPLLVICALRYQHRDRGRSRPN